MGLPIFGLAPELLQLFPGFYTTPCAFAAGQIFTTFPVLREPQAHCLGVTTPCITLTPCPCQSAGDQLSQELKHVRNELERVKGELGTWGWLF